ncbi:MAG: radical SAM protein [Candidatus Erginobacter occultus]|nr:radical SAM protein [Candidatus Erginobacter occultus]
MTTTHQQWKNGKPGFSVATVLPRMGWNFLNHNLVRRFARPILPRALCAFVTYRCNLRCRMCGIWKQDTGKEPELSLAEWDRVLSDPLFSRLEYININGGEPNLRDDLPALAHLFTDKFPHLRSLSLNSNGIPAGKMIENARTISGICRENGVRFSVSVSLHKIGPGYDEISGVKDTFGRVRESLAALKAQRDESGFYLGVNCVITGLNVPGFEEVKEWGEGEGIPVNFTLGEVRERFNNSGMRSKVELTEGQQAAVVDFFRGQSRNKSLFNHHALRYRELADMLGRGAARRLACHYAMGGVIVGWDGSLFYCKDSKSIGNCRDRSASSIYYDRANLDYRAEKLLGEKCRSCPPNTLNRIELEKDIARYLWFLVKP